MESMQCTTVCITVDSSMSLTAPRIAHFLQTYVFILGYFLLPGLHKSDYKLFAVFT